MEGNGHTTFGVGMFPLDCNFDYLCNTEVTVICTGLSPHGDVELVVVEYSAGPLQCDDGTALVLYVFAT